MIRSMTAFARSGDTDSQGELVWEIRSVNHRYLETLVRLPEEMRSLDPLVRERVSRRLGRGKVDCVLRLTPSRVEGPGVKVNQRLARQIIEAASEIGVLLHDRTSPRSIDILRWPGVLEVEETDFSPLQRRAAKLLDAALADLLEVREREGRHLADLVRQRCAAMREQVAKVKGLMPTLLQEVKERLRARLAEVSEQLNEERLEQEMVLLAQRLDLDEEMDRMSGHLAEVEAVLERREPVGRRLDFLMQELNREANTLASKSTDVEVTRSGVEMKVLIEQMREQVQNIE